MSSSLENRSSIRKLDFPTCSLEVLRRLHLHFSAKVPISPSKGSVASPVGSSGSLMSPKGNYNVQHSLNILAHMGVMGIFRPKTGFMHRILVIKINLPYCMLNVVQYLCQTRILQKLKWF